MAAYFPRFAKLITSPPQTTTLRFFYASPKPSPQAFSSFRALKSAIKSESDPVKIAKVFETRTPLLAFHRHRPLYQISVQKLARSKRYDLIDRILTQALNTATSPREGFWLGIFMLYSKSGMLENALQVFDKMLNQKKACVLTEKSLCVVLSALLENNKINELLQTFQLLPLKMGVNPGVKSYNLVLKALCKENRVDEAKALVEKMGEGGVNLKPDIDSYNILLGACRKSRSEFDAVVKVILEKGLEPNLTTYNHRILRLCKSKECARAKKLLDEMVSKGVKPDSTSYNHIIFGFCKVGDMESARKVMEKMGSDGHVSPTSFGHYTMMKQLVEEAEYDAGLKICKEIIKRKWVPPFEATMQLVNGLVKISKTEEARGIVYDVKRSLRGNALCSWGKVEAALLV